MLTDEQFNSRWKDVVFCAELSVRIYATLQRGSACEDQAVDLSCLLGSALRRLEQQYVAMGADDPGMISLEDWANLLRVIPAGGIELAELPDALRLSKRAVRTRVATAVRRGWVENRALGIGRAVLKLTEKGTLQAARWPLLEAEVERLWPANELRQALRDVVSHLPLEHPHFPASYGPADGSVTGGNGADWKPVFRGEGDAVSKLPLMALLSQTSMQFALDYEDLSPLALRWVEQVVVRVPQQGVRAKDVADKVAVSALVRHGFLSGGDVLSLTEKGADVRDRHAERVLAVEDEWRARFFAERVERLRTALTEAGD